MPQKHKKDVRFNLRMNSQLYQKLRAAAESTNSTVSNLVRLGMLLAIEKYGQKDGQMEQDKSKT